MAAEPERRFVTDFFPTFVGGDEGRPGDRPLDDARVRSATEDALLILNYHLPSVTPHVWGLVHARRCVCADGGANRLYDELPTLLAARDARDVNDDDFDAFASAVRDAHVPRAIVGDLDSVRPEVLAFYQNRGCETVDLSHDQDTTDLHKAVTWLERQDDRNEKRNLRRRILVTGALGGRFDHEMSHLSCLHAFSELEIVLVGRTSTARLIPKGLTTIVCDTNAEGPTCGLFPLLGPATVSTTGLRWNLHAQTLTFGTLISTSNRIECAEETEGTEALRTDDAARVAEKIADEKKKKRRDEDQDEPSSSSPRRLPCRRGEVRVRTDAPLVWTTDVTRARGLF